MAEILMQKMEDGLHPVDADGFEAIRGVPEMAIVRVKFSVPRNVRQHRLFFALINLVFMHQREPKMFPTREALRKALTIAVGHFQEIKNPLTGKVYIIPDSIAFGAMDQVAWKEFFEAAKRIIQEKIVPGVQSKDLDQALADMLRLPGPDQLDH